MRMRQSSRRLSIFALSCPWIRRWKGWKDCTSSCGSNIRLRTSTHMWSVSFQSVTKSKRAQPELKRDLCSLRRTARSVFKPDLMVSLSVVCAAPTVHGVNCATKPVVFGRFTDQWRARRKLPELRSAMLTRFAFRSWCLTTKITSGLRPRCHRTCLKDSAAFSCA